VIHLHATNSRGSSFLPGAELLELFPTPLLRHLWPDSEALNAELRDVILARMRVAHGESTWQGSNIGGWHSPKDLDTWPHPCVGVLSTRIQTLVQEMVARVVARPLEAHLRDWSFYAWANVSYRGAKNASHVHSHEKNTIWSGIYYVDAGEDASVSAPSGVTKFEDRSGVPKEVIGNPDPFEREFSVTPQPGLMVLFSSKLWHRVEPFEGTGARITVAFNVSHPGFVVPVYPASESSDPGGLRSWMWRNFRGVMLSLSRAKQWVRSPFRPMGTN
jgi:uncharacterized protein (TIGR02466 family)